MDKIDHAILNLLVADGRISFREMGEAVHLSANAAAERFRRLCSNGTLRHIRATVNPAALGRPLEAVIEVKLKPDTAAQTFEAALRHLPQVVSASLMTGSYDYAVRVACCDQSDLIDITEALRREGVQDTYTRLLLREVQLGPR